VPPSYTAAHEEAALRIPPRLSVRPYVVTLYSPVHTGVEVEINFEVEVGFVSEQLSAACTDLEHHSAQCHRQTDRQTDDIIMPRVDHSLLRTVRSAKNNESERS